MKTSLNTLRRFIRACMVCENVDDAHEITGASVKRHVKAYGKDRIFVRFTDSNTVGRGPDISDDESWGNVLGWYAYPASTRVLQAMQAGSGLEFSFPSNAYVLVSSPQIRILVANKPTPDDINRLKDIAERVTNSSIADFRVDESDDDDDESSRRRWFPERAPAGARKIERVWEFLFAAAGFNERRFTQLLVAAGYDAIAQSTFSVLDTGDDPEQIVFMRRESFEVVDSGKNAMKRIYAEKVRKREADKEGAQALFNAAVNVNTSGEARSIVDAASKLDPAFDTEFSVERLDVKQIINALTLLLSATTNHVPTWLLIPIERALESHIRKGDVPLNVLLGFIEALKRAKSASASFVINDVKLTCQYSGYDEAEKISINAA